MVSITLDFQEAAEVSIHTLPTGKLAELAFLISAEIVKMDKMRYCKFEIGEVMITLFEERED